MPRRITSGNVSPFEKNLLTLSSRKEGGRSAVPEKPTVYNDRAIETEKETSATEEEREARLSGHRPDGAAFYRVVGV